MKLVGIIRSLVLEYIHDDADLIVYETIDGVDVEVWKSPHTEELRGDKKRIPENRVMVKLIQESIPQIVKKYFQSGKNFRLIDKDDPKKVRFAIRRIKGQSRPQMILQIEELTENKITLNMITFLDNNKDLFSINNPNQTRFILDIGEKDLVGK
jgi:hypothetical protein